MKKTTQFFFSIFLVTFSVSCVQNYKVITIGKQVWMIQNLNVDEFQNGDPIPNAKTNLEWIKAAQNSQPAYCYYKNLNVNGPKYGKLYNWYAVNDPRGLAPKGFHIPSEAEWEVLRNFVIGSDDYDINCELSKKIKSIDGWGNNNKSMNGDNSTGFNAYPSGVRLIDGQFEEFGFGCGWWTSTEVEPKVAWDRYLGNNFGHSRFVKGGGLSVRCLMD